MRFLLALAVAAFPASLLAAATTVVGPCPPGFVQAGSSLDLGSNGRPVTITEETGLPGTAACVPAQPLRGPEIPVPSSAPQVVPHFNQRFADRSELRLVSLNPPSPTMLAQQTSSRVILRTYDDFDRVKSELVPLEDGTSAQIRYTYWKDGLRKTMTDAFNRVTFYEYDGQARLERVTANQGLPDEHVTTYTYWPDDLLKTITAPNGVVTSYDYDRADRVKAIVIARDGVTLASYAYTYDPNGNRLTQTETNGGPPELTTYTYDNRDRLESVTYPGGSSVLYEYDAVSNRTRETERDASGTVVSDKTAEFDAVNRLSSVTDSIAPANDATFTYDANGNLTSKTTAAGTETYDYEVRDLMVESRSGDTITARFAYDAFGRRYLKVSGDEFTPAVRQYLYDQTSLLHELDSSSLEVAKYEYGGDRLLSLTRTDEPRRFYHQDALGSVVALSDNAGAVVARYHLDAWGRYRTPSELDASANRFGFTGYLFDQETELYWAKARFYDPEYGRFTSQDSVLGEINEPPSLHRYFYGYANPLRYIDPTGHQSADLKWEHDLLREASQQRANPDPLTFAQISDASARALGSLWGTTRWAGRGAWMSLKLSMGMGSPMDPYGSADTKSFHEGVGTFAVETANDPRGAPRRIVDAKTRLYNEALDRAGESIERADHFGGATGFTENFTAPTAVEVVGAVELSAAVVRGLPIRLGLTAGASRTIVQESASETVAINPSRAFERYVEAEGRISSVPRTAAEAEDALRMSGAMADLRTQAAAVPRTQGRFGTRAHGDFETTNTSLDTATRAEGSPITFDLEQFRLAPVTPTLPGAVTSRRARGSLGLDALVSLNGVPVRGFDLKTGRGWSATELGKIEERFGVPVTQIRTR
jgi:RHS repeat-associated protein